MSGMIYAVIVVMWAAFLVPMWLRRHDEFAEAKSVDKFASKMRVLARRSGEAEPDEPHRPAQRPATADTSAAKPVRAATAVPSGTISSTVRIVGRADDRRRSIRDAWADDADDAALAALAAPDLARDLARDRGLGRAPATLAARRRRVLAVLGATTLLLVALAALSITSWIVAGIGVGLTTAYVLHLRIQAKRTREIARRRSRAAARVRPAGSAATRTRTQTVQEPIKIDLLGDDLDETDGWQPVSVPVPTYVTAPRAGRAIRRINLQSDDAWTSGRLVADAAAAGRAAAAAAHQESIAEADDESASVQRAVGD